MNSFKFREGRVHHGRSWPTTLLFCVLLLLITTVLAMPARPVSADPPLPGQCDVAYPKMDGRGMVAYWTFDDQTNPINDDYGAYSGVNQGTVWQDFGVESNGDVSGGKMRYGGGDYIDLGTNLEIHAWPELTISLWFQHDGTPNSTGWREKIIDKTTWSHDLYLALETQLNGQMFFQTNEYDNWSNLYDASHNYGDQEWYHVVILKQGSYGEMYVNGVSTVISHSLKNVSYPGHLPRLLLGYSDSTDPNQRKYWHGWIDEVALFDRLLTPEEIGSLYQNGLAHTNACSAALPCTAPEASDYTLVYSLAIPEDADYEGALPPYSVDNAAVTGEFDRAGYCIQLDEQWIWVSMDAFTDDPVQLGVPVISTGAVFQQTISNMTVASNVPGIVTGTGIATGNIEFWHNCYGQLNALSIPGASDTSYDFGDRYLTTDWPPSCYGSMQVHNYGAGQTLFAYNQWDAAAPDKYDDLGIGNDPQLSRTRYHPDWTYSGFDGFVGTVTYATRNLYVMVQLRNHPPTAENDVYTVAAGQSLVVPDPGVLDNDDDPEGQPLSAVLVDDVDHGALTLYDDGSFSYTPVVAFIGQDSFTYQAFDGEYYSHEAKVTIDVTCTLPHAVYDELDINTAIACANAAGAGTHTINLLADIELSDSATPFDNTAATEIVFEGNGFTVDGNNSGTVFYVVDGTTVRMKDLVITGGHGSGVPGNPNSGGALYNTGVVTFEGVLLTGNYASVHGGAALNLGTLTITDSTVSGNNASGWGAGVHNSWGTLIIERSTFSGNNSQGGGAFESYGYTAVTEVINSTISGNSSRNISTNSSNVTFVNSTIASGTALYSQSQYATPVITFKNSIVLGGCTGNALYVDGGANLGSGSSCGFTPVGLDPTLGPLQDNGGPTWTHALLSGSQAIDGVLLEDCPVATDQRGTARPQGAQCDIGSYEAQPGQIVIEKVTLPPGSTQDFQLDGDLGSIPLHNGENAVFDVVPGYYDVSELQPTHWELRDLSCSEDKEQNSSVDPLNALANIVLEEQETVTCTYTNEDLHQVKLLDSEGNGLEGATAKYYDAGWQTIPGQTNDEGKLYYSIPDGSYKFRLTYEGGTVEKTQDISTEPTVLLQTVKVMARMENSEGAGLEGGSVKYYAAGWKEFGETGPDGTIAMELLPLSYKFRMTYLGGVMEQTKDVADDPLVSFATKAATVRMEDSSGGGLNVGLVKYYAGGWKEFGTTGEDGVAGEVSKELLPLSYKFRMTYLGGVMEQTQDVGLDPLVIFQTAAEPVVVRLQTAAGTGLAGGVVTYYAGGWKSFGTTDSNGEVSKELPAQSYKFKMTYLGGVNEIRRDVGSDPLVTFATTTVTVNLIDHQDLPLHEAGSVKYYAGGWKIFGDLDGGSVQKELLPQSYKVRLMHMGARVEIRQDVGANAIYTFQTGKVNCATCSKYYASGWRPFIDGMQLLPGEYKFRFNDNTPDTKYAIAPATENTIPPIP